MTVGADPELELDSEGTEAMGDTGRWRVSQAHIMVLLCATASLVNYADRVNMSVAIIPLAQEYHLGVSARAAVLGAFFVGYVPSQLVAALLCRRRGAKVVLGAGCFGWSLFTVLTPLCASLGLGPLVACRLLMGLTEGVAFPCMYHVLGEWVPSASRGRAMAAVFTGVGIGTTAALVLAPHIVRYYSWHAIFYIFGGVGFVWLAAWVALARDAPRALVMGAAGATRGWLSPAERRALAVIARDRTCLTQMAMQFFTGMFIFTCLSWLPTYFEEVFHLKVTDLWFTFIPCAASALVAPLAGIISDGVAARSKSRAAGRRAATALACVGSGVLVIAFALARTVMQALVGISASLALFSLNAGGYDAAYLDIADSQYVGLLKSAGNTMGAASGAVAVPIAAGILRLSGSWRVVFGCQALWVFIASCVFQKYGSCELVLSDTRLIDSSDDDDDVELVAAPIPSTTWVLASGAVSAAAHPQVAERDR